MSTDSTVPRPRTIVLCFDGTAGQYDETNTNVVKFFALLNKRCPLEQIVYYQPGVGTFINPGVVSPILARLAKIADLAIAWYLGEHVMGGYKFLMQNYREGDKVCLIGFSRGAYTARALAGLLHKIGLLPRDNEEQVPFAYTLYKRTDKVGLELATGFKRTFCAPVDIDFIGVWDTVASVGLIFGRDLPFTSANSAVRVFRHALSLDEHRARYQPNLFHREAPPDATTAPPDTETAEANSRTSESIPPVREVWFAGCHSDVGGGAVEDAVRYSLGDISLRWMVKQVVLSQCGIRFDAGALRMADIDVSNIVLSGPTQPTMEQIWRRKSESEAGTVSPASPGSSGEAGSGEYMIRKGKERDVETQTWPREQDVLTDIHDELKSQPLWWLLELVPMKFTWQEADGTWKSKWGFNFGRGRKIRTERPNFHETVRQRMGINELKYKPKARWAAGTERYVE